jgi:1-deoxy-D-xylulose-5-phosphate reductoisomerase
MSIARNHSVSLDLAPVLRRRVTVLGSTGSVGTATLDVIRDARGRYGDDVFPLEALTAQRNVRLLAEQARAFRPRLAVVSDPAAGPALREALAGTGIETASGDEAILAAAQRPSELVMAAIVGAAGLAPTLAAVERGCIVALANKECIVAAGAVFRDAVKHSRSVLIPVDSEHNAAFQLLDFRHHEAIEKATLTASGGPFRTWSVERMMSATPEQAVSHPNWSMGAKISVDSATLMNKGLELIEAHLLFGLPPAALDVVIHPQSIVHCLVAYTDGSVLAHLSAPDMRTPIAHALGSPRRLASPARRLDFTDLMQLTFEKPDLSRFPCLGLARTCLNMGGAAPTILNAANEVAVEQFLARRLSFLGIARTVEQTLENLSGHLRGSAPARLEEVLALDQAARQMAREACRMVAA